MMPTIAYFNLLHQQTTSDTKIYSLQRAILPSMAAPLSSPPLPPQVPIRIAVLEADHLLPQTRARYGGYTGLYTLLLHAGADSLDWPRDKLQISKWDIIQRGAELSEQEVDKIEYPQLEDIDAILISGSSECEKEMEIGEGGRAGRSLNRGYFSRWFRCPA